MDYIGWCRRVATGVAGRYSPWELLFAITLDRCEHGGSTNVWLNKISTGRPPAELDLGRIMAALDDSDIVSDTTIPGPSTVVDVWPDYDIATAEPRYSAGPQFIAEYGPPATSALASRISSILMAPPDNTGVTDV